MKSAHSMHGRRHPVAHPSRTPTHAHQTSTATAHPLALPPPWSAYAPPLRVRTIAGLGGSAPRAATLAGDAGLTIRWVSAGNGRRPARADAVLLGDDAVEAAVPSFERLTELADTRVVVASLGCLAKLISAGGGPGHVHVRRQRDAAVCSRVEVANFITRGFALQDAFPCGWHEEGRGVFVQRYLVRSPRLRQWLRRHDLMVVLTTKAGSEYGSGHPMCLYRAGRSGFLLAVDFEPPPGFETARPVSPYPGRLLRQALGLDSPGYGQYCVPARLREEFEQLIAWFCERFPPLRWIPTYSPAEEPPLGWVELCPDAGRAHRGDAAPETARSRPGRTSCRAGLPRTPNPGGLRRVELRTGFAPDEWDLIWGTQTFLKQLVRPGPARLDPCGRQSAPEPYPARAPEGVTLQWIPLSNPAAVPPPAGPKQYAYVVRVPDHLRRRPIERPTTPDFRVDLRRSADDAVVVRSHARICRRILDHLEGSGKHLGVPLRLRQTTCNTRRCELAFPIDTDPARFDAIVAVDRVVRVLGASLAAVLCEAEPGGLERRRTVV